MVGNFLLTLDEKNALRCDDAGLFLAIKDENEWKLFPYPSVMNRRFYFHLFRKVLEPPFFH